MRASQFTGCIVGLAVGDALGYPAEFRTRQKLLQALGPQGITDFVALKDPRLGGPIIIGREKAPGTFTDDTQMSIAVAEALLTSGRQGLEPLMQEMARQFVLWARSPDNDRAPGETCMRGCENLARGVPWRQAGVATSKGCGSAMRVAPIGLFFDDLDQVESVARDSSLLTHGHPAALEAAAAAALGVALSLRGEPPARIYDEIMRRCSGRSPDFDQCLSKVPSMLKRPPEAVLVAGALGEGWVAEEAVASALYCFWRHPDDYRAAVLEAVNTDGDSDSLATITGSFSGARLGLEAIPPQWVQGVEDSARLQALGARFAAARGL